jgi:hypothetical protein
VEKERQKEVKGLQSQEVATKSSHDLCFRPVKLDF